MSASWQKKEEERNRKRKKISYNIIQHYKITEGQHFVFGITIFPLEDNTEK